MFELILIKPFITTMLYVFYFRETKDAASVVPYAEPVLHAGSIRECHGVVTSH